MVSIVTGALASASVTNLCAQSADIPGKLAIARHVGCRQATDLRAVHIKPDAFGHHLHAFFLQTRRRAMVASDGASGARVDTGLVKLMSHTVAPHGLDKSRIPGSFDLAATRIPPYSTDLRFGL